ncbi:hypothetical protein ACVWW6_000212 [Bradyrhizobium sp. USDA 3311]
MPIWIVRAGPSQYRPTRDVDPAASNPTLGKKRLNFGLRGLRQKLQRISAEDVSQSTIDVLKLTKQHIVLFLPTYRSLRAVQAGLTLASIPPPPSFDNSFPHSFSIWSDMQSLTIGSTSKGVASVSY